MSSTPLRHLPESGEISVEELRRRFDGSPAEFTHMVYAAWRAHQLKVRRTWGDPCLPETEPHYSNRACLLPSDLVSRRDWRLSGRSVRVATWNVNSIRIRQDLLHSWLSQHQPDIVCLQETKVEDHLFPQWELEEVGYQVVFTGQKSYNGVAVLSRFPIEEVRFGFANGFDSENKRVIFCRIGGVGLYNIYLPQGESTSSEKFQYKLRFLSELRAELQPQLEAGQALVLLGDINIAPDERDVVDAEAMRGSVSFHPQEHAFLQSLKAMGMVDVFRLFDQEGGKFSWWDFRTRGFERGDGMRIDHIWASQALQGCWTQCQIDVENRAQVKPSDHAPVLATLNWP